MNKESILIAIVLVGLLSIAVIYPKPASVSELKRFSSYEELKNFVKTNTESYGYGYYGTFGATAGTAVAQTTSIMKETSGEAAPSTQGAGEYSRTNIQVEGVDEADIVKNDGKYIYVVSGNKIVILDSYPAENAKILSQIDLNGTASEIFINKDKLIVFGREEYYVTKRASSEIGIVPPSYYSPKTFVKVYDLTDRANPVLKRNVSIDGNYFDSRMIGDYVYFIVNQPIYYGGTEPIPLPVIQSNNVLKTVQASDVYYFDFPDSSYIFTNIVAVNTQDDNEELSSKTFLMGYSENMYVSPSNIYVVYTKRLSEFDFYDKIIDQAIMPVVPLNIRNKINEIRNTNATKYEKMQEIGKAFQDYLGTLNPENAASVMKSVEQKMEIVQMEIAKEMEKTIIHKISVDNGKIEYKTNGEVPGYVLNQFSMDEYNGNFRIATTTGNWRSESLNHVYILDNDLKTVGKLEDLAHGERIYSVRFIGEKGYMVTFRQIDPLFVIDLSDSTNPKVLGFLKISGVSDYLHPYDETHVIGIGRDATEQGRIQGMKLSLFDVSDVSNPKEISKYMIGERGTDSEALRDHKAFLFSKSKNLLVIPIRVSENGTWNAFQGTYVFNLDLDNGFVLKGKITHENETVNRTDYYYDYQSEIRRSLYIDDTLYTISNKMIKANGLENLNEVNKIELPYEQGYYPYYG
jgi:uncharacterized secreted protein with C-terminal beta-propeller domain